MNYTETIEYLYSRLPLFSRIGAAAYKKDLHNTIALCEAIGNPQNRFKSIHVAGTNGKGSTSHMLAAVLQKAGYKTGLYTSPHLKDFRERIRINGEPIAEKAVIDFVENIKPQFDLIEPSFFEATVALAFEYFANEQVDIAVIEVGLGGRLDSTNIINPEISVITNIGWDHMNLLGNTLESIAFEKAGIIKEDIPAVVGETTKETLKVFTDRALTVGAKLILAEEQLDIVSIQDAGAYSRITLKSLATNKELEFELDLKGHYQAKNLRTVLTAINLLRMKGWEVSETALKEGLQQAAALTGLRGRWEQLSTNPRIIADVAHNEDGIKQILEQLAGLRFNNLHWIIGMVNDKDIQKVLSLLPNSANYYFTQAPIPRALPSEELKQKAEQYDLEGNHYPILKDAINAARASAGADDLILICGSVFLVAAVEL
ncbi:MULTISPECIES: bifunctional folylpolyglutamate synthase/dihydrofolate synthase [unclassified Paraflavitalea]|uniref:bifunctional folylpolyglutamate synthase/dihydrofolate synthase n=1 Tax=unclassified Paraflavitalea TaxID=2798305 RepID=UPI003D347B3A